MLFRKNRALEPHQRAEVLISRTEQREGSLWKDTFGAFATRSLQIIIVIALAAGVIWGLSTLTTVFIPIVLAVILASTFHPMMSWLRSKKVPDLLATIIVLLSIVTVIGLIAWLITWAVANQWDDLRDQAESGINQIVVWVQELPFDISAEQIDTVREKITGFLTSSQFGSSFGSGALSVLSATTTGITATILTIVVLFFFLKDGPTIWEFLCRPFTGEAAARANRVGRKTVETFGAYVRGTASVAAVDAVGILIGLLILQVPLAIPLAVLVFVLAFIPIVGATLAGVLAALVALVSNGAVSMLLVIGVVVLVNQLEGNLLQPVLMGRALRLHALVILLALTVGTLLAGIMGAILSVPLAAAAWGIVKVWDGPDTAAKWARPKDLSSL